jgi:hypothetical protein
MSVVPVVLHWPAQFCEVHCEIMPTQVVQAVVICWAQPVMQAVFVLAHAHTQVAYAAHGPLKFPLLYPDPKQA